MVEKLPPFKLIELITPAKKFDLLQNECNWMFTTDKIIGVDVILSVMSKTALATYKNDTLWRAFCVYIAFLCVTFYY